MSLFIQQNPSKPNRVTTQNKNTDKVYHLDYAKWCVSNGYTSEHNAWLQRIKRNKDFYKNNQWVDKEDTEVFLKDSSGNDRNRIKMTNNLIRPMVEQYRGNAIILKINASAQSISPLSITRKDKKLSEKLFKTRLAEQFDGIGEQMRNFDKTLGKDDMETQIIFENLYVDDYVDKLNALLRFQKNLNDFQGKQVQVALNLALSGLICMEAFEHGGHMRFRVVESEDVFVDRDARNPDLSDASFAGYMNPYDPSYILERWQPSAEEALAIENYASSSQSETINVDVSNTRSFKSSRIPVYTSFWKDTDKWEYGYVLDEFNQPYLTRINYTYDGEESPRYTDADLIDPPNTVRNRKLFKNVKKKKLYMDATRYCRFIPAEIIASTQKSKPSEERIGDIVLEFGLVDYQEVDLTDFSNCKFPLKFQTWGYVDGEIFSPVDDAIDPQRFINRVLSVTEQLINNAGGSNIVIDEDSIDPNSKDDIYYDIKEGNPITVRTKGKGVPNTVGYYDNTPKQGTYAMFNIIPTIKSMIQDTTGINEGLRGESTGSDQLVGVTQLLIQRGSLMQEPFYEAMSNLFLQCYRHVATAGKNFYIDSDREIVNILGEEGAQVIKLSKDMKNEDFNVFIERENDDSILKSQANQMLAVFLQQGLIDQNVFANLYNRSTPNDVTRALRTQAKLRQEAQRQQANEMEQQVAQMTAQQQAQAEQQRQDNLNVQNQNAALELNRQQNDMDKSMMEMIANEQKNNQSVAQ